MLRLTIVAASLIFAASAVPAHADQQAIDTLHHECGVQLKLPPAACDCIAARAGELNDNQQAFVAASVTKDEATAATLRGQMTIDELTQAGMFMATSPQACRQGG